MATWSLLSLGVVLLMVSLALAAVTSPPQILSQLEQLMPYKLRESIELPCDARGTPRPKFSWERDQLSLDVSGNDNRFTQQPNKGTIVINDPLKKDEGGYRCFARNDFGVAVSQIVILKSALLDSFEPVIKPYGHVIKIGNPVTLTCTPPTSFPPPSLYWTVVYPDGFSKQLPLSNRITMDPYGSLHFTNVIKSDQDGGTGTGQPVIYQCTANNKVERREVKGGDQTINVIGDTTTSRPPELLWNNPETRPVAVKGMKYILKCIFSGEPTPKVTWARKDKGAMGQAPRVYTDSYGQELVFGEVDFSDAGQYECEGKNDLSANPVTKPFSLRVESKPFMTQTLENIERAENETATFHCAADGIPVPDIDWFINGVKITNAPNPKRTQPDKNTLHFVNLTTADAQVIQCNATNMHGYILMNAYLNVLAIPPEFKQPPAKRIRFAEGTRQNITCTTYAAPKAQITWIKDGRHLTGGRYKVHTDGNLEVLGVKSNDAGEYECIAKNKFGTISAKGYVIVRQQTRIVSSPQDMIINAGDEAKLVCTATTDPEELENLKIKWLRDGATINYALAQRIFQNSLDNSLTITNAQKTDTAVYSCVAESSLDKAEATAFITVRDRPNAPVKVQVNCALKKSERIAIITFTPNGANYAPFLQFIVQYNTTFTPDVWSTAVKTGENSKRVEFQMSPWATYSFRVLARNRLGLSEPSAPSKEQCQTQQGVPSTNPQNVEVEGTTPTNLVIRWTPMPEVEFNAPGFVYKLEWKCQNVECMKNDKYDGKATIAETWRKEHIVNDQLTYMEYKVTVTCENEEGESKETAVPVIGYSGEGIPADRPESFVVDQQSVGATSATLQWQAVRNDTKLIKGYFVGYLIQYWKVSEGAVRMRQTVVDVNLPEKTSKRKKRAATLISSSADTVAARVTDLPAYTEVEMQVSVLNRKYQGQPSTRIKFTTKQGVPGPVAQFIIFRRNSNMLEFIWDPPHQPNGIITGYDLAYRAVNVLDLGDRTWREPVNDPNQRRANISGLRPEQMYRVYIYAKTLNGRGDENSVDAQTTAAQPPSPPTFIIPEVNATSMNVTLEASKSGNPGSVFYVQYRMEGKFPWETTSVETVNNYINVTGMSPGNVYEVRVVSRNGQNQEAASGSQYVRTKGYSASTASIALEPWFILMLISVLILIILFIVIWCMKKKVKPRYPDPAEVAEEREKKHLRHDIQGREPHRPYRDDPRYHHPEYVSNPAYNKSQDSLHKEPIPYDDEPYQPPRRHGPYGHTNEAMGPHSERY
ncbi:neuroglian-like isoform X1 [Lineus longissimus]|uniref:neuroglian-like isoform X1 n=1 Tax=Lineus longissimus TaxID=88925 RepID=UPI00315D0E54